MLKPPSMFRLVVSEVASLSRATVSPITVQSCVVSPNELFPKASRLAASTPVKVKRSVRSPSRFTSQVNGRLPQESREASLRLTGSLRTSSSTSRRRVGSMTAGISR